MSDDCISLTAAAKQKGFNSACQPLKDGNTDEALLLLERNIYHTEERKLFYSSFVDK